MNDEQYWRTFRFSESVFYYFLGLLQAVGITLVVFLISILPLAVFEFFATATWTEYFANVVRDLLALSFLIVAAVATYHFIKWHRIRKRFPRLITWHNREAGTVIGLAVIAMQSFYYSVIFWNHSDPGIFEKPIGNDQIWWYAEYLTYNSITLDFFDHFKISIADILHNPHHRIFTFYTYLYHLFCIFVFLGVVFRLASISTPTKKPP